MSITACGGISSPGTYTLAQDLGDVAGSDACINIHDTNHVTLDCAGHQLGGYPALQVSNVDQFTVQNCKLSSEPSSIAGKPFFITGSTNGRLTANTVTGVESVIYDSQLITVDSSAFTGALWMEYAIGAEIDDNSLVADHPDSIDTAAMVVSTLGANNAFRRNTINGGWSTASYGQQPGADDGISLEDENSDTIEGNTISLAWDCGIELSGSFTGSVRGNTIDTVGFAGIGGWYYLSVATSTFSANRVTHSPDLFYFERIGGLRPAGWDTLGRAPADREVDFKDISFDANTLASVRPMNGYTPPASEIPVFSELNYSGTFGSGEQDPSPSQFVFGNLDFLNNDFGHESDAPVFGAPYQAGIVFDQGGNHCSMPAGEYPLACQ